ncbi:TPA: hypothetical protein ACH3X2_000203 [Trebouxia sp. C0005]
MPGQPSTALPLRPEPSDVSSGVSSRVAVALLFSVITAATLFSVVVVLVCRKQPPVVSSASLMRRPAQPLHHVSGCLRCSESPKKVFKSKALNLWLPMLYHIWCSQTGRVSSA